MRRIAFAVLIAVFGGSPFLPLRAQDPPTFRTGTTLIEFTVVALDGGGRPVADLTKEELVLTEGGQAREIAFFRFDGGPAPAPAPEATVEPLAPGFITNRPEYLPAPQRNVTAIVMDMINTAPNDQTSVRSQTLRYLKTLPPDTRAGLFRFSEAEPMATLQEITENLDMLRTGLDGLRAASRRELAQPGHAGGSIVGGDCYISAIPGGPSSAASGAGNSGGGGNSGSSGKAEGFAAAGGAEARVLAALNRQLREVRLAKTLASLEALGNHLSGIPGRKSVIWITSGMPVMLNGGSPQGNAEGVMRSYEPQIRQAAQRLANQGIAVYPVDAKGLCRQGDSATAEKAAGFHDAPPMVFATLDVVADTTGGRVLKNTNDPSDGVKTAANDQRGTYTIGFYAADEPRKADDEWRRIEVSAKRRGVNLRHRQGYLAVRQAQPQSWPEKSWNDLAHQPLGSTAIRLNASSGFARNALIIPLQIAAADLYFHQKEGQLVADLEIGLVEKTANGPTNIRIQPAEISLQEPTTDQRSRLIPLETTWFVNQETTAVRVIVRDRFTGRHGTLDLALQRR
jgi:VWFA-related protein